MLLTLLKYYSCTPTVLVVLQWYYSGTDRLDLASVSQEDWRLISDSVVVVDPSVSTYDVIHISRDIDTHPDKTRDWCLHGNSSVFCHCVESVVTPLWLQPVRRWSRVQR